MTNIDKVMQMLNDSDPEVREDALDELVDIKPSNVLEIIKPYLLDDDSNVRSTAASSLGLINDSQAVPYLIDVVKTDSSESVRSEALLSLAEYRGPEILECLIAEVKRKKKSRRPRQEVAKQLKYYDTNESISCLITLLQDDDDYVRINAVDSLYKLNHNGLQNTWNEILQDSNFYVSDIAQKALAELKNKKVD